MKIKQEIKKYLPDKIIKLTKIINSPIIIVKNKRVISSLLDSGKEIKLELGAGTRKMKGWTTIDRNDYCDIVLDLRFPVPFPDNSVDQIYTSHLLEHFYYLDLVNLISECYRILKKIVASK